MKTKVFSINKDCNLENLVSCKLKDEDIILIHNGVSSPITKKLINELIETAKEYGAAVVGIKIRDTIKEVDKDNFVIRTLDRKKFWEILYPQAIRYGLLKLCNSDFYRIDSLKGINIKIIEMDYNLDLKWQKKFMKKFGDMKNG